jgi:hypothetical protein
MKLLKSAALAATLFVGSTVGGMIAAPVLPAIAQVFGVQEFVKLVTFDAGFTAQSGAVVTLKGQTTGTAADYVCTTSAGVLVQQSSAC